MAFSLIVDIVLIQLSNSKDKMHTMLWSKISLNNFYFTTIWNRIQQLKKKVAKIKILITMEGIWQ